MPGVVQHLVVWTIAVHATAPPSSPVPSPGAVQSGMFGTSPFPTIAFHFVGNSKWMDTVNPAQLPTKSTIGPTFLDDGILAAGIVVPSLEDVISVGECAALTSTFGHHYFTYASTQRLCFVHASTPSDRPFHFDSPDGPLRVPRPPPDVALHKASAVGSADQCRLACLGHSCVGWSFASSDCTLATPSPAALGVVAGWVHDPVELQHADTFNFMVYPHARLDSTLVQRMQTWPTVSSIDACASLAYSSGGLLFAYDDATHTCELLTPHLISPSAETWLVHTNTTPVVVAGSLVLPNTTATIAASSAAECHRHCLPSRATACFGSVFDATTHHCRLVSPSSFESTWSLGWVVPQTLASTLTSVSTAQVFAIAHQDDRELFMAPAILDNLQRTDTKSIFLYLSAGDGGFRDGWWEAREAGTLAAADAWVTHLGLFHPVRHTDSVVMGTHHIHRVAVGNAFHYFLALPEQGALELLRNTSAAVIAPLDQPTEMYTRGYDEFVEVVQAILAIELAGMAHVGLHVPEFNAVNAVGDHELHTLTGLLLSTIVDADPMLRACVNQSFYMGYPSWAFAENLIEPGRSFQRFTWQTLTNTLVRHPTGGMIWNDHAKQLGRTYIARRIVANETCALAVAAAADDNVAAHSILEGTD
ncbi:Aste57867_4102 [Aphanomyces stellatus]|uniref:Aste57867_4102 protein n=1 Tax=Aphanomyces stellatus TaxID=120398 RepID=A0A485KC80_9STRA|nr:hypothetical protein As57867_004091 [Aphanomyces stellatus]VFT81235.1 Aste57867_4102 [Aphanomyces stellatus]